MSGEKCTYIRIRKTEYDRMMRTCRRVENFDEIVREKIVGAASKLKDFFKKRMTRVTVRQDNIGKHVSEMSDRMQRLENAQSEKVREHAERFRQGIEALNRDMRNQREEYNRLIREQGEQFGREMQNQRRELEAGIGEIQADLSRKESSEKGQAEQWLDDTRKYLDMIGSEFRHDKFKPGALERIMAETAMCQDNYEQGIYQASVAASQQSFLRAAELRLELEQLEMEWEAHLELARRRAAELIATCDAQETCRFAFETDEGAQEVQAEIDFWTEGALGDLKQKAESALERLGEPNDFTLDDLKRFVSESEGMRQECLGLAERAKEALLASQLRNNIGQTIEAALADSGWEVTDAVYEGEDHRRAVHVKIKNLPGDEIVTIIAPEFGKNDTIRNRVDISFFDRSTNDESFRMERLAAIMNILREEGLECTPPACTPGEEEGPCKKVEKLDFDRVRQAKQE